MKESASVDNEYAAEHTQQEPNTNDLVMTRRRPDNSLAMTLYCSLGSVDDTPRLVTGTVVSGLVSLRSALVR